MALPLTDSENSLNPNFLIGENYQLSLKQSMEDLLAGTHKEAPYFSVFIDKFYLLMQAKIDAPLESIWVYSALSFRSHNCGNEDPLNRLSKIKDLFKLVSSCSSPCNSSKSIALLAPVVFEVYKLVVEVLGKDLGSKGEKKMIRKVKSLVEVIIGYISMCCVKGFSESNEGTDVNFLIPVEDLVSIWMDGNVNVQSFLPLVSNEICKLICERGFDVNHLAGVVMVEAYLLKLSLDLKIGNEGVALEKELRSWAVASISSFGNFYFFEMLARMLLMPALPVTALLEGSEDVVALRNILYDAVILVEYSFLKSETVHLPADQVKNTALTRLIVTLEATEFFRKNGDQKRATRYTSAFADSCLPSQITKWISHSVGPDEKAGGSSPKALTKWLLKLERKGIKLFDDSILKYLAKSLVYDSKVVHEESVSEIEEKKLGDDSIFYVDKKGEGDDEDEDEENKMENESMTAEFVAAAHSMRKRGDSKEKRKGIGSEEKERIKYFKYDVSCNSESAKDNISISASSKDDSSSESEVENPVM